VSSLSSGIAAILTDAGYLPHTEANDVEFKVEGRPITFQTFAGDDTYARMLSVYQLPDGASYARALSLANANNLRAKAVKTSLDEKARLAIFSIEQFVDNADLLRPSLERGLAAIRLASDNFFEDLRAAKARKKRKEHEPTE